MWLLARRQLLKSFRLGKRKGLFYSSRSDQPSSNGAGFSPRKVLILTKLSRLEFEKIRHSKLNDAELEKTLRERGSDYSSLLYHHYIHKGCESRVEKCFQEFGTETRLVNRLNYNDECIEWADLIVTTGGDGTFLMAASRIPDQSIPVIGFNSDPTRSEGHLCLPKNYSVNIREAIKNIIEGKFKWTFRRRIRVTLIGENVYDKPVELHDQQLQHPEFRFFDCLQEQLKSVQNNGSSAQPRKRVLPVLALNEVYLGENVSARVSYFEVAVNRDERIKTKNAGMCVSTGTGSTSWSYNISKISPQIVSQIIEILADEGVQGISAKTKSFIEKITKLYNERLTLNPEMKDMLYNIRDPITSYTLPLAYDLSPRGLARRLEVRSRCFDASLVIDGGLSFSFNDGTVAILEVHDSDALRTVVDIRND
ncbi:unnamed protein product [Allacma fusca]|uniref:NAD(+) kinase n=1 Tax=Allacma fusca TaxID=39272 RepID=A0A8J2NI52_9HEXA|nr:unnamed protein product [Allacma fusca]